MNDRARLSLVHRVRPIGAGEPRGRQRPILILLHGVGSNELAMAAIAPAFDPRFEVLSVRAPIELGPFAFGWFPIARTPDSPAVGPADVESAWSGLSNFIDEAVVAYGGDPDRVFLAGFSQGGIVAVGYALAHPSHVAGAVSMSGWLPPEVVPAAVDEGALAGRPILVVHGLVDQTIEVAAARAEQATLSGFPVRLDYVELAIGHTTTDESVSIVAGWLADRLGP
jgi:phospholipase/carboxylesterase